MAKKLLSPLGSLYSDKSPGAPATLWFGHSQLQLEKGLSQETPQGGKIVLRFSDGKMLFLILRMYLDELVDNLKLAFTDPHYCCVAFSFLRTKSSYQMNLVKEFPGSGEGLAACRTDVDGEWHLRNVALLVNQPCFWAERNDGRSYDDRHRHRRAV